MNDFRYYADCFASLHTAVKRGRPAPHKALLLLSVIDLVECGFIRDNRIELSDVLVRTFNDNARKFFALSPFFHPEVTTPFFHMGYEPFWRLVEAVGSAMPSAAECLPEYSRRKPTYSLKGLREQFRYAEIDLELFELLKDEDVRARLRVLLISNYLNTDLSNNPK